MEGPSSEGGRAVRVQRDAKTRALVGCLYSEVQCIMSNANIDQSVKKCQ